MWLNQLKTVVLLAILSGIFLLIGGAIGGKEGLQFAFIIAIAFNFLTYFFSEKLVLSMYRAKPLDKNQYNWIYEVTENLTKKMNIPMPRLWIIETPMANAFATGRNPKHSSVVLSSGILDILDKDELSGVIAHELSHIKNRDTLIATIAATIATSIGYLARMAQFATFSRDRNRNGNPIVVLFITILMPIAAAIIQLAISRSREYLADESGAKFSHKPLALASALDKLHNNIKYAHLKNNNTAQASTASLFIVHPFTASNWTTLFSTHPPIQKRILKLRKMAEKNLF
jgi:heat shock protein HtpX